MTSLFSRVFQAGFHLPDFTNSPTFFEKSSCRILDGKALSQNFVSQAKALVSQKKITPTLAVILVGEDPASQVYVKNKIKLFHDAGFESKSFVYAANAVTQEELMALIQVLNKDNSIHGILLQLPLPASLDGEKIGRTIAPQKDVDGFLPQNMGSLTCGDFSQAIACTPFGIMALLCSYGIALEGKHAVVVGRSTIVGKPMGLLLLAANATVTFAHSKTKNLGDLCRSADILVVAAGKPGLITKNEVQPQAIVVDVGIHRKENGFLCGDVHENVKEVASALTPVPGGVGPMTIAMLMVNTSLSAWG